MMKGILVTNLIRLMIPKDEMGRRQYRGLVFESPYVIMSQ